VKAYAQGLIEVNEILQPIAQALASGQPVKEWLEYRAPEGSLEEALLAKARPPADATKLSRF